MTPEQVLIVQCLALSVAPFLPSRSNPRGPHENANRTIAARTFRAQGAAWRSGQTSPTARARANRELHAAAGAGFLTLATVGRSKWPWFRLTALGESTARHLIDWPHMDACLSFMGSIAERAVDPLTWTHERALATNQSGTEPIDWYTLLGLEAMASPGLLRGWIEARSNRACHAFYRLTPAGLTALESPPAEADEAADVLPDDSAVDVYLDALDAANQALRTEAPSDAQEIGWHNLSNSQPWNAREPWGYPGAPYHFATTEAKP